MLDKKQVETIKKLYPKGTKIHLYYMNDTNAVPSGTNGVVDCVDDIGTIHVIWENGSTLGLVYGEDKFEIIKDKKIEKEAR